MDAIADLAFRDRALVVGDALVVADLHVGKGASGGVELPVGDGADLVERLETLLAAVEPERVIVAGDLLHSFSTIPQTVTDTIAGLRKAVADVGADVVVTPGNHDTMLASVWDGETADEVRIGDTVVCHGHEAPTAAAGRYVIGHDHPTIDVEGRRRPCYLVGEGVYEGADVVMVPSFNRLLRGVEVRGLADRDLQSPLCGRIGAFAPVVRDDDADETYTFPPLAEFRHRL